jgi:HD-like signal output (HDOD) protein
MQLDEEKELKKLVASGIRIPPQPKVVIELQELILGGDYDVREVVKIISQDPGIVAMLFKASKSPVFARGRALTSIDKVVMVVGVKQVFNLVQAAALATTVSDGTRKAFDVFWTRSNEVAQLAALIADERVTVCNVFPEQAYMAGIFHECGVPVLMMRFPEYCKALQLESAQCWPSLTEEDKRFNVDHTTIGYLVARHWKLPDFVCSAIRYHHDLPDDELGASLTLVCILQLGIHFYHRLNRQDSPLWPTIGPRVLAEIGLSADEEDDFFGKISDKFIGVDG